MSIQLDPSELIFEAWPVVTSGMHVGMPKGVRVTHKPTRITVTCDSERSQHKNRDLALIGLQAMLDEKETP